MTMLYRLLLNLQTLKLKLHLQLLTSLLSHDVLMLVFSCLYFALMIMLSVRRQLFLLMAPLFEVMVSSHFSTGRWCFAFELKISGVKLKSSSKAKKSFKIESSIVAKGFPSFGVVVDAEGRDNKAGETVRGAGVANDVPDVASVVLGLAWPQALGQAKPGLARPHGQGQGQGTSTPIDASLILHQMSGLRDTENAATPELRSHQQTAAQEQPNPPASESAEPRTDPEDVDHDSPPPVSLGSGSCQRKHTSTDPHQLDLSDQDNEDKEQPSTLSQLVNGKKKAYPTSVDKEYPAPLAQGTANA
ncbi:hypothetical protein L210DRAFT_3509856 [Boletus edulis BED1]|uniref:Uncharacterized protein n=1 Tax=Boletus edulis BED1 TaxID=1328754 RepID=A0AAD4G6X9_BOLED|nr:hypothetical protein L210DRAFT_3509856 [Boletus edulis BED1]